MFNMSLYTVALFLSLLAEQSWWPPAGSCNRCVCVPYKLATTATRCVYALTLLVVKAEAVTMSATHAQ
jgi:hypothetical protein